MMNTSSKKFATGSMLLPTSHSSIGSPVFPRCSMVTFHSRPGRTRNSPNAVFAFWRERVNLFARPLLDQTFGDPRPQLTFFNCPGITLGNRAVRTHEERLQSKSHLCSAGGAALFWFHS